MQIPMFESQTVTIGADGTGIVRFSPGVAGSSWKIQRMVTAIDVDPQQVINLVVYRNVISESNRLDGTTSAAQDASETNIDVGASDTIIGLYSGAPVGSHATLTLSGTKETGRR